MVRQVLRLVSLAQDTEQRRSTHYPANHPEPVEGLQTTNYYLCSTLGHSTVYTHPRAFRV